MLEKAVATTGCRLQILGEPETPTAFLKIWVLQRDKQVAFRGSSPEFETWKPHMESLQLRLGEYKISSLLSWCFN